MRDAATAPHLYLASQSPRRRQLLEQLGLIVQTLHVDVPEVVADAESARQYNLRVAQDKAKAGWSSAAGDLPVLGADTEVVLNARVLGKPADAGDAATMLSQLSGRTHEVITAVAVVRPGGAMHCVQQSSRVTFCTLSNQQIDAYVSSGEPMGKAGAYAIQGQAGAFVLDLHGSFSGVMGLPLYETGQLLAWANIGSPLLALEGAAEGNPDTVSERP